MAGDAAYGVIHTDEPVQAGGRDTAMSPFDLFFASIAACMGFYALRFCQERGLATEGLALTLEPVREHEGKHVSLARIAVHLPVGFPDKYITPIERAMNHCAVKKHIVDLAPPAM